MDFIMSNSTLSSSSFLSPKVFRFLRLTAAYPPIFVCFGGKVSLIFEVESKREGLQTAYSNNIIWTLSQIKKSYLEFVLAVELAVKNNQTDYKTLNENFDVFYGWVTTILASPIFNDRKGNVMNMENQTIILEVDRIAEMRDSLGTVALAGLFDRFLNEGDSLIEHLSNPEIRQEPLTDVIAAVHKVAGSAAVLGTIAMRTQLQLAETEGKSGQSEKLWKAVDELERIWLRTKSSLNESGFLIP